MLTAPKCEINVNKQIVWFFHWYECEKGFFLFHALLCLNESCEDCQNLEHDFLKVKQFIAFI